MHPSRRDRRNALTLGLGLLAACTAPPAPMPTPAELGDRVRIRIDGRNREVPSITTADYFLSFVALGPDGQRKACRVYAPESAESEGLSLSVGSRIFRVFAREGWPDLGETRHGDPALCEDLVLPPGVSLCFEPGTCFAYRIVDHGLTMAADLDPEIRIGQIRADGSGYVELQPGAGPVLPRADDPPNWPPPR